MFKKQSEIKSRKFSQKVINKRQRWKAGGEDKKNRLMLEFLKEITGGNVDNY